MPRQVVKARVLSFDPVAKRMRLTLTARKIAAAAKNPTITAEKPTADALAGFQAGDIVEGTKLAATMFLRAGCAPCFMGIW